MPYPMSSQNRIKVLTMEAGLIQSLSHLPHTQKLLYRVLWEMADPIGIVRYDLSLISEHCGVKLREEDFSALGKRVYRVNDYELLLPLYLKAHAPTLSPKCRGQAKIWRLIKQRFDATPDKMRPFYDFFDKCGVSDCAPEMLGVYLGEDKPLPKYLIEHREKIKRAESVDTPYGWPEEVVEKFKLFIQRRVSAAYNSTSKADCNRTEIDHQSVILHQQVVGDALNRSFPVDAICQSIYEATVCNYNTIRIKLN